MRFSIGAITLTSLLPSSITAFTTPSSSPSPHSTSHTKLHALPPFIIGPAIRRLREEQAKKNQPLATDEEKQAEAPGLKIGTGVWKWPPVWPYEERLFLRSSEKDPAAGPAANPMASLLQAGGMGGLAAPEVPAEKEGEEVMFDAKKYWMEDMKEVKTVISPEAIEVLQNHFSFYLKNGDAILELGAAENSYLPSTLQPSRHVGISLSPDLMSQNPSLTDRLTIDLNDVIPEIGIADSQMSSLGEGTFDAVIVTNTVDFLTRPREVFRSVFRLLKPGGVCMVAFVNKDAYTGTFGPAQTKMWEQFNDDQHIWCTGSFFQFSAEDGWVGLKGFDISPAAAKEKKGLLDQLNKGDKPMNMYVVQASKAVVEDSINTEDPEKSFRERMWILPTLEMRDKALVIPRLARSFTVMQDGPAKNAMVEHVALLPKIYESLIKMDQFAFPFSLQAQLATDLVVDLDFTASEEQMTALKMGLGLRKPSPEFWEPVGRLTAAMPPEEKVSLLSFIVPRFTSLSSSAPALQSFVTGLEPTFALLRSKCPTLNEDDIQTVGSELLACEILTERSSRREFALWLGELTEEEIKDILKMRKSYREEAMKAMNAMREERERKKKEEEETMKKYKEQMKKAREERTMVFNEKTGKMELMEKK